MNVKTLLLFLILFSYSTITAQNSENKWYFSVGTFATDHTSVRGLFQGYYQFSDWSGTPFGKIVLSRNISKSFAGELQALAGEIDNKRLNYNDLWLTLISLGVRYKFTNDYILKEGYWIDPYLKLGVGYHSFDYNGLVFNNIYDEQGHFLNDGSKVGRDNLAVVMGAGINFWLNNKRNVGVNIETQYDWMPRVGNDYIDFFQHSIGLALLWGKPKSALDTDGDTLIDIEDNCPFDFGPVENKGCPIQDTILDTDLDGIIDIEDACVSEYGIASNNKECNGCPDTDNDGMCDKLDSCPAEFGLPEDNYCPKKLIDNTAQIQELLKYLLFDSNKSTIRKGEIYKVDEAAKLMSQNNDKYLIVGHTDSYGQSDYNLQLSEKRAKTVMLTLIGKGISADRLQSKGEGENNPICHENTDKCNQENRRVDIIKIE